MLFRSPLQYGDVSYGVLVVVLRADATLAEPEQRVLSAVAQSTAMALHDLTSQRLLGSDDVIELSFSLAGNDPFFIDLSNVLDTEFDHAGTITRDDGQTTLFFETEADPDTVVDAAEARADVLACTPVTAGDGRTVVEFTRARRHAPRRPRPLCRGLPPSRRTTSSVRRRG